MYLLVLDKTDLIITLKLDMEKELNQQNINISTQN